MCEITVRRFIGMKERQDTGVTGEALGNLEKADVCTVVAGEVLEPDDVAIEGEHRPQIGTPGLPLRRARGPGTL